MRRRWNPRSKRWRRWGAVHVLVNNAGIIRDGQLSNQGWLLAGAMSDAQFDPVIGVNLKGVFICTRAVAPRMIGRAAA